MLLLLALYSSSSTLPALSSLSLPLIVVLTFQQCTMGRIMVMAVVWWPRFTITPPSSPQPRITAKQQQTRSLSSLFNVDCRIIILAMHHGVASLTIVILDSSSTTSYPLLHVVVVARRGGSSSGRGITATGANTLTLISFSLPLIVVLSFNNALCFLFPDILLLLVVVGGGGGGSRRRAPPTIEPTNIPPEILSIKKRATPQQHVRYCCCHYWYRRI